MVKFDSADHALRLYEPEIVKVLHYGSTSMIGRLRAGIVLKSPRYSWWDLQKTSSDDQAHVARIRHHFSVEQQILEILGEHPRIIKYGISLG